MRITREQVLHVAALARIELDDTAIETFAEQIGTILDYVDTLNSVDTTGDELTSHAVYMNKDFREDIQMPHLASAQALANAPEQQEGHFQVPRIIG